MAKFLFASLFIWALGSFTSISLISLVHVAVAVPILWEIRRQNFKAWTPSMWALTAFSGAILLSVFFNLDIMVNNPWFEASKVKYFLVGVLSISPFVIYKKEVFTEKNIKILFYVIIISSILAAFAGLVGVYTGWNPLKQREVSTDRNAGLFGTLMTYAHALTFFMTILTGLILYRKETRTYFPAKILVLVWIINAFSFLLTYTRGAWLGFAIALPFLLIKTNLKNFIKAVCAVTIASILIWILVPKVRDTFLERQVISDNVRIAYWKAAFKAFEERPIFGIGFQNFEPMSLSLKQKYQISNDPYEGHAHNNFLEVLATTGAVGFLCFISWIFLWAFEAWKRNDFFGNICFAVIVSFCIGGLTQVTVFNAQNIMFILIIYSLSQIKVYEKKLGREVGYNER